MVFLIFGKDGNTFFYHRKMFFHQNNDVNMFLGMVYTIMGYEMDEKHTKITKTLQIFGYPYGKSPFNYVPRKITT
jgi:hypothetical protein